MSAFTPRNFFLVELLEEDVILPTAGGLGGTIGGQFGPDSGIDLVSHLEVVADGILDALERAAFVGEIGQVILPEGVQYPMCQVRYAVFGDMHVGTRE